MKMAQILRELARLELELDVLGWDWAAADLADVRERLEIQFAYLERFNAVHPRGPDGAFVRRGS